jgi:hypothetical protein
MPVLGKLTDSQPRSQFKLVEIDEDHATGCAFNMAFVVWQHRTTRLAYRRYRELLLKLAEKHPEGVASLQLLGREITPPDAAARREFVEFLHLDHVKHSSVVYEEKGFKAASIRAVVSSAHALARPKFPHSVHSRLSEAARWHAAAQLTLGRSETAVDIESMARTLRQMHEEGTKR